MQGYYRGCVTPKQIANLNDAIRGDFDYLDGYDEIPPEEQERVKLALEQGHVADHDWKGVSVISPFLSQLDLLLSRTWNSIDQVWLGYGTVLRRRSKAIKW